MFGGIVAAGSLETAEAGAEILRAGGNATDAAVGAALAAFHVEPLLASAAGGGLMLAGDPDRGFHTLDFVPATPGLGSPRPRALDFRPVSIDFGVAQQIFHVGRGAAAVPTGLAGLYEGHRRWGRLPLAVVVEPAVRRCREGVHLNDTAASFIQLLKPIWSLTPESAELYTVRGRVAVAGDVVVNPNFADVLELMAREGMRPFQEGEVATRIVDAFGPEQGGLITSEDLEAYTPVVRTPLLTQIAGGTLLTPPPPSTGGSLLAFSLAVLDRLGLEPEDFHTPRHVRALTDTFLLAIALRRTLVARGSFDAESIQSLLTDEEEFLRVFERFGTVDRNGVPVASGPGNTTHVSVMDDFGGAASITVSNGEGCGSVIPGTGMAMNNFLGEEDINPRGFHREAPGTVLASMMSPTIFLKDGKPELVLGSGGSNRLRTAMAQVVCNRLTLKRSIEAAVSAPRIHVEPRHFYAELGEGDAAPYADVAASFEERDMFPGLSLFFGGVHAVGRSAERELVGVGDPRRGGAAIRVEVAS